MTEPLTFLCCDDDRVIRHLLKTVLERRGGHIVVEVGDPAEVVDRVIETQPDLVLLDYVMPGYNGMDVVKAMRENPLSEKVPVVFLTGRSDITDFADLLTIGVIDVIEKPFDALGLVDRLTKLLQASD